MNIAATFVSLVAFILLMMLSIASASHAGYLRGYRDCRYPFGNSDKALNSRIMLFDCGSLTCTAMALISLAISAAAVFS